MPFENNRPLIMLARMLREFFKRDLPKSVAYVLYEQIDNRWLRPLARGKALPEDALDFISSPLINAIAEISAPRLNNIGIKAIVNYNFDDLVDEVVPRER